MTETPMTVTVGELAEAFGRLSLPGLYDGTLFAATLFADIATHREPRHKPGAYEDGEGNLHVRVAGLNAWLRVMDDGTTEVRPDDWVEPPLRKLVPEGSQAAQLSWESVMEALSMAQKYEEGLVATAGRICKLLDGTS